MSLRSLLPDEEIAPFLEGNYQRLPFAKSGLAESCLELGSWESLATVLAAPGADVMVVRQNQRHENAEVATAADAHELVQQGYTLLARHAERHHRGIADLARGFAQDFAAEVNVHMYCTPAEQFGFAWHYDAEEVFIVQTTGRKEYWLRKNSVNPWPLEETLPADMQYEREIMPLMKCLLTAGDWLYIPSGYWHYGKAEETAISLAIGVAPRTGVDLFDQLRKEVLASLLWRQRLPILGRLAGRSDEQLGEALRGVLTELGRDFQRLATNPEFVRSFLAAARRESSE